MAINSADTEVLIGSSDSDTTLWNLHSGRLIRTFVGDSNQITQAKFTPDNRYVVTASIDKTVRVWDAADGRQLREYDLPVQAYGLGVAPDGSSAAFSDVAGDIRVLDICTDCQDAKGLLGLAARRGKPHLNARQEAASNGA